MSKAQLIEQIVCELRKAQREPWVRPPAGRVNEIRLPPGLPLESGKQLRATEELLEAISKYSAIYSSSNPALRTRYKNGELYQLACRAFGQTLSQIDLDLENHLLVAAIKKDVDEKIAELIERARELIEFTVGCHLFQPCAAYPIRVGPVVFETRDQWIDRALQDQKISPVTARRLRVKWAGGRQRRRKATLDSSVETAIVEAVGHCDVVCSVATEGLSSAMMREKALLASRLAMTAIAMMWSHPSQGLEWMNLLYDRRLAHRYYVLFAPNRYAGSSSSVSQMPSGRWTDEELLAEIRAYQSLLDQFGEALLNYVQPTAVILRPKLMNALFLSLWWHHEACRESSDQMATTKFVASLDALVTGQNSGSIMRFVEGRLGWQPVDKLMKDGRSVRAVIDEIYNSRRSRMIHGNSSDFADDWSSVRSTAEAVSRLCLVIAADWMIANREVDDVALMAIA